ncbi:hypothetical protein SAMN05216349_10322 [Oribacterium sp. KHPX15]|uniref:hypothetical protein n=1 Tax=Oribacterium sp. KHPX15 TaxID=1855342 RepID=UPI00089A7F4E|nr:hypothetical protein [Oribacterium sp. KHPX15]SDZ95652.1 hypothetical protein SAMN05216349_10322 [Oribacterium sp. KHPX15]
MSEFKIRIKEAKQVDSDFRRYSVKYNGLYSDIANVKRNIRWEVQNRSAIDGRLTQLLSDMRHTNDILIKCTTTLQEVVEEYISTETGLIGGNVIKGIGAEAVAVGITDNPSWVNDNPVQFGDVIHTVEDIAGGLIGFNYNRALEFLKGATGPWGKLVSYDPSNPFSGIAGIIGGFADLVDSPTTEWSDLFLNPSTFSMSDSVGQYFDFSNASKATSAACNWAMKIFDSGVENYEEYQKGGMTLERFFVETGNEAGLAVVENIALTAAVGAIATAAGITTAPAWLIAGGVAVATIVVDAGLNGIVQIATDNPKAEWKDELSDLFLDYADDPMGGIEAVTSAGQNFFNKTGAKAIELKDTVCEWGSLIFS